MKVYLDVLRYLHVSLLGTGLYEGALDFDPKHRPPWGWGYTRYKKNNVP